jgi:hypothetical protein
MQCKHSIIRPELDQWETFDPSVVSISEARCNRHAFEKRSHGHLCFDHYWEQQKGIPAAPRKRLIPYVKDPLAFYSDNELVRYIIRSERDLITEARLAKQTVTLRFGKYEPLKLELVR